MRVAILSDIHGNASALRAVLAEVEKQKVDHLWCLGDVLGYGPLPISCINLLDEWRPPVWLMGNHDLTVLLMRENSVENNEVIRQLMPGQDERWIAEWHAAQLEVGLSSERIQQLGQINTWQQVPGLSKVYVAHGAILSEDSQAVENIAGENSYCTAYGAGRYLTIKMAEKLESGSLPHLVIVGHTHVPTVGQVHSWGEVPQWDWHEGQALQFNQPEPIHLQNLDNQPVILCPGSVGQPRGVAQDERAAYAILDTKAGHVWFRRVPYSQGEVQAAMTPMPDLLSAKIKKERTQRYL
jgi:predicted phosphodiesterase